MTDLFGSSDTAPITIAEKPPWFPGSLWDAVGKTMNGDGSMAVRFGFSTAERKIFRKRPPIAVSDWAERHRVLTMSAIGGAWRNDVTPHLRDAMNLMALPYVREVAVCKVPQSGFSEATHNFIGYCIDRDPGPVLYVYPDEVTAVENSQDRVQPMIQSSKRLRSYFTDSERDKANIRINLRHMPLYFGWARSASRLANKPIKIAVADEIDKDGFDPGTREAAAIELIRKRLITYRRLGVSKLIMISTPTVESGNIWREFRATQIQCDFWVRCPLCDQMVLMDFKGIHWPGGGQADPREVREKRLAWYECDRCGEKWDDTLRDLAAKNGKWMVRPRPSTRDPLFMGDFPSIGDPGDGEDRMDCRVSADTHTIGAPAADLPPIEMLTYCEKFKPATVGLHFPAWADYFISLSDSAAAFLEGLNDLDKLQDFMNSFEATPWKDREETKSEEEVLRHRVATPPGIVPADAVALTCGIDMQMSGFWFVVRAWRKDLSSHLVQYGYINTWKDVENLLFNTRFQVEGKAQTESMPIWRAAIDTGGGKDREDDWSKTEEAYNFIRKNGRGVLYGIKGTSHAQLKKVTPKVIDRMTRGNKPIPGGITLYFLDTDKFKDQLHWRLGRSWSTDDAAAIRDEKGNVVEVQSHHMTLHADTGVDYARQILAEERQKDKKGKTEWVAVRRDNHLLDCEVYAAACADPEWAPSLQYLAGSPTAAQKRGRRVVSKGVEV